MMTQEYAKEFASKWLPAWTGNNPDKKSRKDYGKWIVALAIVMVSAAGWSQDFDQNNIDNFQFQATNVTNVSQVLTYSWRNTGTQANVDQSCSITGGTAMLMMSDSTGTQVCSRNMADGGSVASTAGLPGT